MTSIPSRRPVRIAAIAGAVMLLPMVAFAGMAPGDSVGTSEADIRAALAQQGYAVGEVETEDGSIQAEVTADGRSLEITVDRQTGKITAIEQDDRDRTEGESRDRN